MTVKPEKKVEQEIEDLDEVGAEQAKASEDKEKEDAE